MAYLGRLVGVGLTKNNRPCGVYAVSGRSEMSKKRIAEIKYPAVIIGPSEKLTPEQEKMRDLIFYDAIRIHDGKGRVIISNGNQTGPIELMLQQLEREERELDFPLAIAHGFVDQKGAEPDSYRTPRIAGILNKDGHSALGIVTKDGLYTEKSLPRNTSGVPGAISYVSTYKGDPLDKNKIVVPGELRIPSGYIGSFDFGSTAQKFADNIFDWIDPDFVVCAAAVIWNPDTQRWDLAVRNLHK